MRSILPYPVLGVGLAFMWLLLTGFTPAQLVLSIIVAIICTHALSALGETSPGIGRWLAIPQLFGIVLYDIVRSNIAVSRILLSGTGRPRTSGFVVVPVRLRNPAALAILSIIVTSTPGTAWLDYNSTRGEVLIHVFDLVDDAHWVDIISNRYEKLLLEIFR